MGDRPEFHVAPVWPDPLDAGFIRQLPRRKEADMMK